MLAAGIVEVLARCKNFDRLRPGLDSNLQQAGAQALIHEQMRRQDSQLGQGFPRAGWIGNANQALYLLLHLRNQIGVNQISGKELRARRKPRLCGRVRPGSRFSQYRNYFHSIENEQIKPEQK
jgi:hypothetical protein